MSEDQRSEQWIAAWSWATNYRTRVLGNIELFHSNQLLIALTDLKDSDLRADLGLKVPRGGKPVYRTEAGVDLRQPASSGDRGDPTAN